MLRVVIFVLTMSFALQVFASIGKVSAVRGDAKFLRDNQELTIKVGDVVEEKDQIKTGQKTQVQIVFSDRTIVTIGKETVFSIPQYVYGDASNSKAQFNLAKGVFKSISGKIGKLAPQRFKIKTKTSTIGIRGTTYIVRVVGSETSLATLSGETYMVLNSNGASYTVPSGKELVYNVDTGQVTLQDVTTTSVSVNTQTSDDKGTQTADSNDNSGSGESGGTDDAKSGLETNVATTSQETLPTPITAGKTAYSLYGYWENPVTNEKYSPFFGNLPGVSQTTETQYSDIKNSVTSDYAAVATYSGNLTAVSGTKSSTGDISMKVNFTKGTVSDAYLTFTLNDEKWDTNFSGTVSTSGIKVTSFTASENSAVKNITGNLKGTFYGTTAKGVGGDFSLSGTNASGVATSASGAYGATTSAISSELTATTQKVQVGSDSYTSYGYWLNSTTQIKSNPYSDPLSGVSLTPAATLEAAQAPLSYSGNLVAISGTASATGTINMNITSGEVVGGSMQFTLNGNNWSNDFSNSGNTIDAANSKVVFDHFTPSTSNGSNMSSITGSMTGYFYGSRAEGLGGTFNLNGTTNSSANVSAQGSFAASGSGTSGQP